MNFSPTLFLSTGTASSDLLARPAGPDLAKSSPTERIHMFLPYCLSGTNICNTVDSTVALNDLGVIRGYGIFDFLRTYNGVPFRLTDYIERFRNSAASLDMELPFATATLAKAIRECLSQNLETAGISECAIRMLMTGGLSEDGYSRSAAPAIFIMFERLSAPSQDNQTGIAMITDEYLRDTPRTKTTNYVNVMRQQKRLLANDAKELLYHWNGDVLEASRSNIFAFFGDTLVTPFDNILLGKTRATLVDIAPSVFTLEERALPLTELLRADEVFITGSGRKVTPVIRIGETVFSNGKPGPRSKKIAAMFEDFAFSNGAAEV